MTIRGYKQTPEHIAARIKRGDAHPNWIGDAVSERGGRSRALRLFRSIGPCARCGAPDAERHHVDGNTANNAPSNITPLCHVCHMTIDGRLDAFALSGKRRSAQLVEAAAKEKRSRVVCKRGHSLADAYVNGGRRHCKECGRMHSREYQKRKSGGAR